MSPWEWARKVGTLIIAAGLIEYRAVPQLVKAHSELTLFEDASPWLLVAALALEIGSLLCYTALTRTVMPVPARAQFSTQLSVLTALALERLLGSARTFCWPVPAPRTQRNILEEQEESPMSATLKLTHKAIGVEVRRGTYDVVIDGARVGSVDMNATNTSPVAPGTHTLQVRRGRNSSRTKTFYAAEGETVAFRCTGKSILPIFLVSFFVPSLALTLIREQAQNPH